MSSSCVARYPMSVSTSTLAYQRWPWAWSAPALLARTFCVSSTNARVFQVLATTPFFINNNFLFILAFDYTISGAINKDRMWLPKEAGLQFEDCSLASSQPSDLDKFAKHLLAAPTKQCVIVDCSGSPDVAKLYAQWQCMGIDVVSCNNFIEHGFSNELPPPRRGLNASSVAGHLLYDLALGAGVPLPKHLVHLSSVGDKVLAVEGVVSATWSYILNHLMPGGSVTGSQQQKGERLFSQLLKDCSDNYLLEKDPLHDICGHEAARSVNYSNNRVFHLFFPSIDCPDRSFLRGVQGGIAVVQCPDRALVPCTGVLRVLCVVHVGGGAGAGSLRTGQRHGRAGQGGRGQEAGPPSRGPVRCPERFVHSQLQVVPAQPPLCPSAQHGKVLQNLLRGQPRWRGHHPGRQLGPALSRRRPVLRRVLAEQVSTPQTVSSMSGTLGNDGTIL